MTNVQKNEVKQAILNEIERLGSANKVATKCEVSSATISQIKNGNWGLIKSELWQRIATRLNFKFSGWQTAEIGNYKMISQILVDAKNEKLFIPISERAGSGKSETVDVFSDFHSGNGVFMIRCDEWAKREFLTELCGQLGIEIPTGVISIYKLGQKIIQFFEDRAHQNPLLIIDEADKLKAPALRFLIPLFNRLEDKMGLVILGTENLEKEIKNGVRLQRKGYDEIDSRFGRNYIHLNGATKTDVAKIAIANGIEDKKLQKEIFDDCKPIHKLIGKQSVKVVEDLRRVKRVIKRELLNLKTQNYVEA